MMLAEQRHQRILFELDKHGARAVAEIVRRDRTRSPGAVS
jgi:DeoR/GlpR family transcriptional regulator of sugar metabolism